MTVATAEMDRSTRLARLRWQCRRGMRELDELLLGFVAHGYNRLDGEGQTDFERLLDYPDQELLEWLMGRAEPMDGGLKDVVQQIRSDALA